MHLATLKNTGSHSVLLSVVNTSDKKRVNNKAPIFGALLFTSSMNGNIFVFLLSLDATLSLTSYL